MVIDFHVHAFPDRVSGLLSNVSRLVPQLSPEKFSQVRRMARMLSKPVAEQMHKAQTTLRVVPESARRGVDQLAAFAPLYRLFLEGTPVDLLETMDEHSVDQAVLIAHPPMIPNEFVLEVCQEHPRLIPAVNIPVDAARPAHKLKKYAEKGARLLKIHPSADGEGPDSPRYKALLKTAADLGMPVIVHTGCIHSRLLFKCPELGDVRLFTPWFDEFKDTTFVLAHMNFHDPHLALDIADTRPNVLVDTSWQPAEIIGEAARRIGAERVLFGTDWPIVGDNINVGLSRVRECVSAEWLRPADADLILGKNAERILGLADHATPREDQLRASDVS